jgi:hypothetical protein
LRSQQLLARHWSVRLVCNPKVHCHVHKGPRCEHEGTLVRESMNSVTIFSPSLSSFNCLENSKTCGECVSGITRMFHFSPKLPTETFSFGKNISRAVSVLHLAWCNGSFYLSVASTSFTVTFIRRLLTSSISSMRSIEILSVGRLGLSS